MVKSVMDCLLDSEQGMFVMMILTLWAPEQEQKKYKMGTIVRSLAPIFIWEEIEQVRSAALTNHTFE